LPDGLFSNQKYQLIPIWVNFGGSCDGRCWCILWPFGISHSHLAYLTAFGHILWKFGIFSPVYVSCSKENLATLLHAVGRACDI
jgi:hypothetical protein